MLAAAMAAMFAVGVTAQNPARDVLVNRVPAAGAPIDIGEPFLFLANGTYCLAGTTSEHEGFQMYRSNDLANWDKVG